MVSAGIGWTKLAGISLDNPWIELVLPGVGGHGWARQWAAFGVAGLAMLWTWLSMVCLGLAWLGLAWLGLAWLGLAWLGLAWLGLARVCCGHDWVWFGLAWLCFELGMTAGWAVLGWLVERGRSYCLSPPLQERRQRIPAVEEGGGRDDGRRWAIFLQGVCHEIFERSRAGPFCTYCFKRLLHSVN